MKFTPEVVAALQVLKDAAENDFERHRINILERDLTTPPTPEVIDDTHQRFNEVVYTKHPSGSHYGCANGIHRAVYAYYYGEIPTGYEIHHIDENKSNNDVSNLVALTTSEHQKLHNTTAKFALVSIAGKNSTHTKRVHGSFVVENALTLSEQKLNHRALVNAENLSHREVVFVYRLKPQAA